jgi:hypothetical protein
MHGYRISDSNRRESTVDPQFWMNRQYGFTSGYLSNNSFDTHNLGIVSGIKLHPLT